MSGVQVLVAALQQNIDELLERMHLDSSAIIVNQCDKDEVTVRSYHEHDVKIVSISSRGVGINRNTAILHSTGDILLFSDQDIVYETSYAKAIEDEFHSHPEADMILFNIAVAEERKTYENTVWKRVRWYNCGRYGAVSFAIRREKLLESRVMFSQLFGGGAKYSAGEDSLFLKDLIDNGVHVYASPILIGREEDSESTWFKGYDEKFFFDRGVLYHQLYGRLAKLWALRFLVKHKAKLCEIITFAKAYKKMIEGIHAFK